MCILYVQQDGREQNSRADVRLCHVWRPSGSESKLQPVTLDENRKWGERARFLYLPLLWFHDTEDDDALRGSNLINFGGYLGVNWSLWWILLSLAALPLLHLSFRSPGWRWMHCWFCHFSTTSPRSLLCVSYVPVRILQRCGPCLVWARRTGDEWSDGVSVERCRSCSPWVFERGRERHEDGGVLTLATDLSVAAGLLHKTISSLIVYETLNKGGPNIYKHSSSLWKSSSVGLMWWDLLLLKCTLKRYYMAFMFSVLLVSNHPSVSK